MVDKLLSRTEMKILVHNKMKINGLSYKEAYDELAKELKGMKEINKSIINNKKKEKKKEEEKCIKKKNMKKKMIADMKNY